MASLIRRLLRASSVADYMVQASFQQSQEAKHSFQQAQQAQQLSDPASQAASQLAAKEPASEKPRSQRGIEQRCLYGQQVVPYRPTRGWQVLEVMTTSPGKSMEIQEILGSVMQVLTGQEANLESSKGLYRGNRFYLTVLPGFDRFWNFMTPDMREPMKIHGN